MRDPVFPRRLSDSQSYVMKFINVDSLADSLAMLIVISDLTIKQNGGTCGRRACTYFVYECEFKEDACIRTTQPFLKVIAELNFAIAP